MKTRAALRGSGGTAFPGSTAITNLLPVPVDLSDGVWIKAGTPDVSVANQVTWTAGTGTDRIREQWFTAPSGNRLIFLFRCRAAGVNDNGTVYYARTGIRYFENGGAFILEDRTGVNSHTPRIRNDGVMRNYNAQFLAQTSGADIMFDLYDHPDNDAGTVIEYENVGLYDVEGLTGWVHDAAFPQVRFNLDKKITWWGDSTGTGMVYYLSDWLNTIHNNDEAVGGETSAEILIRFNAEPTKHTTPTIIWVGHNSVTTDDASGTGIKADIATMTDALDILGTDYRVLTLLANSTWTTTPATDAGTTLAAVNSWINSTYTTKAVDVYTYLRTKGDGGANDIADVSAGLIPRSLQADAIHLNGLGKDHMLDIVFESVDVKGWHG